MTPQSAYDHAAPGAKQLCDLLHKELTAQIDQITRKDTSSQTSFGAEGYKRFVFAYPGTRAKKILCFFRGDAADSPLAVAGMPEIRRREKLKGRFAMETPFMADIERESQINPFAKFLVNYCLPKAAYKNGDKAKTFVAKIPEEVAEQFFNEGKAIKITVNRYERDPKARRACLKFHGPICQGCDLKMEAFYGEVARGFIHVHHLVPLSKSGKKYLVNPKTDLAPLCPNCHAVVHLKDPAMTIAQLREIIHPTAPAKD